jgi:hypothetical protein
LWCQPQEKPLDMKHVLNCEPGLEEEIRWLLGVHAPVPFTKSLEGVESFLRIIHPGAEWTIFWTPHIVAWRYGLRQIDRRATALSLAFMRSIEDQFRPCADASPE